MPDQPRAAKGDKAAQPVTTPQLVPRASLQPGTFTQQQIVEADANWTSPAALQSNRLAAQVLPAAAGVACFAATGQHIVRMALPHESSHSEVPARQGKEGILLPRKLKAMDPAPVASHDSGCEVQSLRLVGPWLASVDNYGHVRVTSTHMSDSGTGTQQLRLQPELAVREAGWAGVDGIVGSGGSELTIVTAAAFARQLCAYACGDGGGGRCVRTLHTLHTPAAVVMIPPGGGPGGMSSPPGQLAACVEGAFVSLWDLRQGERGGVAQRLQMAPPGGSLYCLEWSRAGGGLLGTAGTERCVCMLEPRRWRQQYRWVGVAKYAVHHLAFSTAAPEYAYVAGLDYECVVGRWDGQGNTATSGNANSVAGSGHGRAVGPAAMGPDGRIAVTVDEDGGGGGGGGGVHNTSGTTWRSDSRLIGLTVAAGGGNGSGDGAAGSGQADTLVACSQRGSLYVLRSDVVVM